MPLVGLIMGLGVLLIGNFLYLDALTKEHPLPDRVIGLPAPKLLLDSAKAQAGTGGLVVYAKEPMSFDSPASRGFYVVYGYVEASQVLNGSVAIYARTKDPGQDPACKVFVVPFALQGEAVDSTVYVCEEGQDDIRVASAEFANAGLSSFCSMRSTLQESARVGRAFVKGRFWIGIRWNPLFPHPIALSFSNVVSYGPAPFILPSLCTSSSRRR